MNKQEHCRINMANNQMVCEHCGATFLMHLPMDVDKLVKKLNAFSELHKDCILSAPPLIDLKELNASRPIEIDTLDIMSIQFKKLETGEILINQ